MVAVRQIRKRLTARPFRQFRIVMETGEAYDVLRPEFVMVLRSTLIVGYLSETEHDIPDGLHYLSARMVSALLTIVPRRQVSRKGPMAKRATRRDAGTGEILEDLRAFAPLRDLFPCLRKNN